MKRREFITLIGGAAAAWPLVARAQQPAMPVIGALYGVAAPAWAGNMAEFRRGLGETGFVEGRNVAIEYRWANGQFDQLPGMAADLVSRNVAVILAGGSVVSVQAAMAATKTIPIVFTVTNDPVAAGFVASLNRPGGNVTGVFFDFPEFSKKWLELMKETLPRLSRIGVLWDPATGPTQRRAIEAVAAVMNIALDVVEVRALADLNAAMAAAVHYPVDALVMLSTPLVGGSSKPLAEFTLQRRLPAVTLFPDFARSGGLMGYGPNVNDGYHQLARMVAKALQGAKPAELPVELPTKFELVVNLKTAKALGIELPTSVLLRADEVID